MLRMAARKCFFRIPGVLFPKFIDGCGEVGRSPWTAADAPVGLRGKCRAQPDQGVRRGRGRPPYAN